MAVLEDMKKSFMQCAAGLGDYDSISKTDLANGYCDAEEAHDEVKRSQYYSALMLRYWYKIFDYQKTCASLHLEIEDYVSWLEESFYWAFRYRAWRKPYKYDYELNEYRLDEHGNKIPEESYGDPNGPDKVFNRCFFSTRGRHYQHSNKDVRKINYTTYSIDASTEEFGDSYNVVAVEDDHSDILKGEMMSMFVKKNKFMEALVLDGILYHDVFDEEKEAATMKVYNEETDEYEDEDYYKYGTRFNIKKLVKHLKAIDDAYLLYFQNNYNLTDEETEQLRAKIKSVNPNNMKKIVTQVLYNMSKDKNILNLLGI